MGEEWLQGADDNDAAGFPQEEGFLCPHSSLGSLGISSEQVLVALLSPC